MPYTLKDRVMREIGYYCLTNDISMTLTQIDDLATHITEETMDNRAEVSQLREEYTAQRSAGTDSTYITTIKQLRLITGLGLKEAKDIVETWRQQTPLGIKGDAQ